MALFAVRLVQFVLKNHSGCSVSQGWSAEHWMAKSSATSRPRPRASATRARRSSRRPELGVDRGVAAGRVADRPRAARVVGRGHERVVPALAVGAADRVDRRQVERRRTRARPGRAAAAARRRGRPTERGKSSYQEPKRASTGSTCDLEGPVGADRDLLVGVAVADARRPRDRARRRRASSVGTSGSATVAAASTSRFRSLPVARRATALSRPAPSSSSPPRSSWPAAAFRLISSRHDAGASAQARTVQVHAADRVERDVGLPAHAGRIGVDVVHRRLLPAAGTGPAPPGCGPQHLVAVADDVGPDGEGVTDRPFDRVPARDGGSEASIRMRAGVRAGRGRPGREDTIPCCTQSARSSVPGLCHMFGIRPSEAGREAT